MHPKAPAKGQAAEAHPPPMPRRKYGHMVTNIGKKADSRHPVPGCPKCARGACGMHL